MINNRTSNIRPRNSYGRGYGHRNTRGFRRNGFSALLRRNASLIVLAAVLLTAGVVCIILFTGGSNETVAQNSASVSPAETFATETPVPGTTTVIDDFSGEYNYEGVDESVLAGLAGTDESLFTDESNILVANGIKIGITIGNIETENDKLLLSKMQETTADAVRKGLVYEVYCYDAGGSYNQQLQDMNCLIKNEVDVIVVGATDAESFNMVTSMAAAEGIPVVAYDAPLDTGYAVNVVSDQTAWGEKQGQFMVQNLQTGNVVEVLGDSGNSVDTERKTAIESALSSNTALTFTASYASWDNDAAQETVAAMLENGTKVDGIITEDGMAQGILNACIKAGKLPKVMCGDVSAGFIKNWYTLKHGGMVIAQETKGNHTPPPKIFPEEGTVFIFCAQPSPGRASSIAFDIALKLAEGRTLKQEGAVYNYSTAVFITDENLSYYYEIVKNMPDSYMISDPIDTQAVESLFNPA